MCWSGIPKGINALFGRQILSRTLWELRHMNRNDTIGIGGNDQLPAGIRTEPWDRALATAEKTLATAATAPTAGKPADDLAEAVIARGYARLYGGTGPTGQLPQVAFEPAAAALADRMRAAERDAAALPVTWRQAGPDEADALVARLLQARMDGWAATTELVAASESGPPAASTSAALEACEDALDRFDRRLASREDLLATLVGTGLLDEWRRQLATERREPLPWWLDGRLERRAEAMVHGVDRLAGRSGAAAKGLPHVPATTPLGHPLAAVRPVFVQEYAAAAEAGHSAEARQFRWRSADGDYGAALIPPPQRRAVPKAAVLEFTTAAGAPAAELLGRVVFLRGVAAAIMRSDETPDAAVVARFPGEVITAGPAADVLNLALAGDAAWEPVVE